MVGSQKSLPSSEKDGTGQEKSQVPPETAESLEKLINELLNSRQKHQEVVKIFQDKQKPTNFPRQAKTN